MTRSTQRPLRILVAATALLLSTVVVAQEPSVMTGDAVTKGRFVDLAPVTTALLNDPPDEDWLMWRRTVDGWGFSPLDQIDRENVDELRLVWTRPIREGTSEIAPLAYGGMLFVPQFEDRIEAMDAATGDLVWRYDRSKPRDLYARVGFNAKNNRNLGIYGRNIINASDDQHIFALDAATGETVWETKILDYKTQSATASAGPLIADGLAITGRSCRPWGGPEACVIVAHDAKTGEEAWRRRLVPAPGEPGDETWGDVPYEKRLHVGSWMVPSFDPALGLVYIGTSVTSPAPKMLLGGSENKHLFHNSTLALDIETGAIRWFNQHLNDHWDLDHPFARMLVDTQVAPDANAVRWIRPDLNPSERRKVVTGVPGKTGIVYTLDRKTGEFLWATPTIYQNVIVDIDTRTGEAIPNKEVVFTELEQEFYICPGYGGGTETGSYSPQTNTMYLPFNNNCMTLLATKDTQSRRALALSESGGLEIYSLAARQEITRGTDKLGTVRAVSAETGETLWLREDGPRMQSLVATAGGLLFGGNSGGRFKAFDQATGDVLWEIQLGSEVTGYPISYAVGGRQYVAVTTGAGFGNLSDDYRAERAASIFVFALPD